MCTVVLGVGDPRLQRLQIFYAALHVNNSLSGCILLLLVGLATHYCEITLCI